MHATLTLSHGTLSTAGVLLLAIVAIEYGGWFMLRVVRGRAAGRGVSAPNRSIALLYAGVVSLAVGVVALGVGLLTA